MDKLCECGCGAPVELSSKNRPERGYLKGEPMRFVRNHRPNRGKPGPYKVARLKYGVSRTVWTGLNSRAEIHRARAERALGKPLPKGAEVHHLDRSRSDDSPLVICENHAYHMLLHRRERLFRAGANPNTERICPRCKQTKLKTEFIQPEPPGNAYCRPCHALNQNERYHRMRAGMR